MWTTHGCRRSTRSWCPYGTRTYCDGRRHFVSRYGDDHAHAERRLRVTRAPPVAPPMMAPLPTAASAAWPHTGWPTSRTANGHRDPALNRYVVQSSSGRRGPSGAASGADSRRSRPRCREQSSHAAYVPAIAVRMYRVAFSDTARKHTATRLPTRPPEGRQSLTAAHPMRPPASPVFRVISSGPSGA